MYKRHQYKELRSRIEEPRDKIQVISGPRQVGKSTLVKQVLSDMAIRFTAVSADNTDPRDTGWIGEIWETARQRMRLAHAGEYLLVIDEVHKIDNWSEAVKKEWDADTFNDVNIKVVLLGSSRLLLKNGLTESLAGRYELIRMPHWSYTEVKEAFGMDIDHYIFFGGFPGGIAFTNNEARWRHYIKDSIIAPAIEHDILMTKIVYKPELMLRLFELGCTYSGEETKIVYKPELMLRLFELGCTYSGEEIALNKLLGQLQDVGNVTTLANYLTTLDESRLLCGLQKYLLSALSGYTYRQAFTSPKIWGRWAESAVGAHLLNMADETGYRVYYWRNRDDEVDFVLEYNHKCIAIEVKSGRRTANNGIRVFKEKFSPVQTFIVGTGGIPLEEFLSIDPANLLDA